jgi:hypothetical protein
MVASTSSSVWAMLVNPASYWLGAKYTPCSSYKHRFLSPLPLCFSHLPHGLTKCGFWDYTRDLRVTTTIASTHFPQACFPGILAAKILNPRSLIHPKQFVSTFNASHYDDLHSVKASGAFPNFLQMRSWLRKKSGLNFSHAAVAKTCNELLPRPDILLIKLQKIASASSTMPEMLSIQMPSSARFVSTALRCRASSVGSTPSLLVYRQWLTQFAESPFATQP